LKVFDTLFRLDRSRNATSQLFDYLRERIVDIECAAAAATTTLNALKALRTRYPDLMLPADHASNAAAF
jgi:hypothetical protein